MARVKVTFKSTTEASGDMLEIKTGTAALRKLCAGAPTVGKLSHQVKSYDPLGAMSGSMSSGATEAKVTCGIVNILVGA